MRYAIAQSVNKEGLRKRCFRYRVSLLMDLYKGTAKTPDGKDYAETVKSPLTYNP